MSTRQRPCIDFSMKIGISNHLASARKRRGFTQAEMAFLLGLDARQRISRYELNENAPDLDELLAYLVIFDMPLHELFPDRFERAQALALDRMKRLTNALNDDGRRLAPHKQAYLREAIARIERDLTI